MDINLLSVQTIANFTSLIIGILVICIPITSKKKNGLFLFIIVIICAFNEYQEQYKIIKEKIFFEGDNLLVQYENPFLNMTKQLIQYNRIFQDNTIQIFFSIPRDGKSSYFKTQIYDKLQNSEFALYIKIQAPVLNIELAQKLIFGQKSQQEFFSLSKRESALPWIIIDNMEKSLSNKQCFLCEVLLTVQKSFKLIILLDSLESYPLIYRNLPIFRGIQKFEGFDHQTIVKYALDKFQIILSKEDTELIKTRFQMDWFYQVCSREIKSYKGLTSFTSIEKLFQQQEELKNFMINLVKLSCQDECFSVSMGQLKNKFTYKVLQSALSNNLISIIKGQVTFFDKFIEQTSIELTKNI